MVDKNSIREKECMDILDKFKTYLRALICTVENIATGELIRVNASMRLDIPTRPLSDNRGSNYISTISVTIPREELAGIDIMVSDPAVGTLIDPLCFGVECLANADTGDVIMRALWSNFTPGPNAITGDQSFIVRLSPMFNSKADYYQYKNMGRKDTSEIKETQ